MPHKNHVIISSLIFSTIHWFSIRHIWNIHSTTFKVLIGNIYDVVTMLIKLLIERGWVITLNSSFPSAVYHMHQWTGARPITEPTLTCLLSIGKLQTSFSEIWIAIQKFDTWECIWKCRLREMTIIFPQGDESGKLCNHIRVQWSPIDFYVSKGGSGSFKTFKRSLVDIWLTNLYFPL